MVLQLQRSVIDDCYHRSIGTGCFGGMCDSHEMVTLELMVSGLHLTTVRCYTIIETSSLTEETRL